LILCLKKKKKKKKKKKYQENSTQVQSNLDSLRNKFNNEISQSNAIILKLSENTSEKIINGTFFSIELINLILS